MSRSALVRPSLLRLAATLSAATLLHGAILWQVGRHVRPRAALVESGRLEAGLLPAIAPEEELSLMEEPEDEAHSLGAPSGEAHPKEAHSKEAPALREMPPSETARSSSEPGAAPLTPSPTEPSTALPPSDAPSASTASEPAALDTAAVEPARVPLDTALAARPSLTDELARAAWSHQLAASDSLGSDSVGPDSVGAGRSGNSSDGVARGRGAKESGAHGTAPARLASDGLRVCRDVLGARHFGERPSALVRVAISAAGDVRFAGLAEPHPGGSELARASAVCVGRLHFAPARDERGRATASSAVLRLSAAR